MIKMKHFILSAMMVMAGMMTQAQDVVKELKDDVNRSAGTYYSLPAVKVENDTPAPGGKKPFYINHYACPSSYYLQKEEYYDEPLEVFMKADSLGKLTKLGKDVLRRLEIIHNDAHNRTAELTKHGAEQSHGMMKLLVERFPDAFTDEGYYSIRSVVQGSGRTCEGAAQRRGGITAFRNRLCALLSLERFQGVLLKQARRIQRIKK